LSYKALESYRRITQDVPCPNGFCVQRKIEDWSSQWK